MTTKFSSLSEAKHALDVDSISNPVIKQWLIDNMEDLETQNNEAEFTALTFDTLGRIVGFHWVQRLNNWDDTRTT